MLPDAGGGAAASALPETRRDSRLRDSQVAMLYDQSFNSLFGTLLSLVVVAVTLRTVAPPELLGAWVVGLGAVALGRLGLAVAYRRAGPAVAGEGHWLGRFVIGAAASGTLWGLGVFLVSPEGALLHFGFYLLWMGGIVAAAVTLYAVVPAAYLAFVLPVWLVVGAAGVLRGDELGWTLLLMMSAFFGFVSLSAWRVHRHVQRSLELQFENSALIGHLDAERSRVEALNEQLHADLAVRARTVAILRQALAREEDLARQLRQLSSEDGLTGIANRRHFDEAFAREWGRALRDRYPLALLIADLDFFKPFNDRYGHTAGDECLIQVAAVLRNHCRRPGDLAVRYGGEEFAAILPETGIDDAFLIAERIRADVAALQIPHDTSAVASVVTISIGVATLIPARDMSPQHLIEMADAALYKAKAAGRNRVERSGDYREGEDPPASLAEPLASPGKHG